ncbi:MAG TPA: PDGLE domain-containing protein, partial [Aggregatilineaceae bacterium]|nr:PDGLE domain-containing protein [Aggregatilineaceae bacterium]
EDKSFLDEAKDAPFEILPDYTIPFIENEAVTTIAAGVIGVLVVLGIGVGIGRLNDRKRQGPDVA